MKIFIDTNVLISAALFPKSVPYYSYLKAVSYPNKGVICDKNIEELRIVFQRKFPPKKKTLDTFLSTLIPSVEVAKVPKEKHPEESKIRDIQDRKLFRAALSAGTDIILTGDKDFLEAGIKTPKILTPAEFLNDSAT